MDLSSLRKRAAEVLEERAADDERARLVDIFLVTMIIASVSGVVLSTVPSVASRWSNEFLVFEIFSVAIFTIEYLLRLWCCVETRQYHHLPRWKARLRWMISPLGAVDLLAIAPFYVLLLLPYNAQSALVLRAFRGLRLLRIFKLARYSSALDILRSVLRQEAHTLGVVAVIMLVVLVIAAWAMYLAESQVQPVHFKSVPASMWWAVVTLTTVGYGDVVPITPFGRLIAGFIAVIGIAIAALPAGILASGFASEIRRREHSFHRALEHALADGRISAEDAMNLEKVRHALGLSESEATALRLDVLNELRQITHCPHCGRPLR